VPFGGISGKAVVSAGHADRHRRRKAPATRDELVARIEVDLLFADGFD